MSAQPLQPGQFVTRNGAELYDPTTKTPLRWVSFNTPTLHFIDDPSFLVPTTYEQEDLARSVSLLGGRVVRLYTLGVQGRGDAAWDKGNFPGPMKHVIKRRTKSTAPAGQLFELNEIVMRGLDNAVAAAERSGIRIIFPFLDNWEWWGGYPQFTYLINDSAAPATFFTDPTIITNYKTLIRLVLTRNNTITGRLYSDEPAILAWETGNELEYNNGRVPTSWTSDIAAHIKSIDKNHLVADGSWKHGWDDSALADPNIDLYSNHYYPQFELPKSEWIGVGVLAAVMGIAFMVMCFTICFSKRVSWIRIPTDYENIKRESKKRKLLTLAIALFVLAGAAGGIGAIVGHRMTVPLYADRASSDAATVSAHDKAFFAGEFGLASSKAMQGLIDNHLARSSKGFAGAMVWSLRGHARGGGFNTHAEDHGYQAYHYPGFTTFGDDEKTILAAVTKGAREAAAQTGYTIPSPALPIPPTLLPITNTTFFRWQGSYGAYNYDLERADGANATAAAAWTIVGGGLSDAINTNSTATMFTETTAQNGKAYSYRVRARNEVGVGEPSNVVSFTA
ncbi:glycoside hydrolase superfamily [Fimicolochytrium jonesii]|uniref:glycoside hydrolase superfamily n=1 Tax=Fimicolochytrium jonesii TaxID=1396493 RepID=UPI0022FE9797|nr:glycoside hydrolase superfamily [Fimicolochytrium jonesii]KAI8826645.1 glycoside hydrolase superfamily [Fimicolochytrium jonesii]